MSVHGYPSRTVMLKLVRAKTSLAGPILADQNWSRWPGWGTNFGMTEFRVGKGHFQSATHFYCADYL